MRTRVDSRTHPSDPAEPPTIRRPPPEAPLVLERYRLRRRLGTGGFATVWLGHDERLDRKVAVKILPRERIVGGRFEREARAAARLAHPGIVTLYEAAVDDEGAYLVSEFVQGATLDELLAAGRLSDRDVVRIGIVLCDALAHAHAHGVIHRDVKPSNVLVPEHPTTPAQLARLTDFGVARVLDGDSLTRTGDVIGTAAYMAPEQAQGLPAGAAADLFSLALVLYEALSGINPLRGEAAATRSRRPGAHVPPLRRQRRDLPRELGRAIDLALRPRPGERGTLEELRGALVAAIVEVDDEPGVVDAPWPTRTGAFDPPHEESDLERPAENLRPLPAVRWPRRALAAAAAGAMAAWLTRHVPGASPIPVAPAGCIAALLVAAAPRAGWLAATAAMAGALALHSQPGAAVLVLAGALVPVLLTPRDGPTWPLAAGAPALAALGLATAWPALVGFAATARRRVVVAAVGWLWVALWHRGIASATSLPDGFHHVLDPVLTPGTAAVCGIWAAASLALPWTRLRRSPELEYIRLAVWVVALSLATVAMSRLGSGGPSISLGSAFAGAALGALVTLVTRRVRAWFQRLKSAKNEPRLA